jgi:large subunit ribosomal protein L9
MKVVLLQNVQKLGKQGDVCAVSTGYARNFLFPRKLATNATADAIRMAKTRRAIGAEDAENDLHATEGLVAKIDGFELEMTEKANEEGTLFASVTAKKIAGALKKYGYNVDPSHVVLEAPIKEIGEHEVKLEFPHGLEASVRIILSQ